MDSKARRYPDHSTTKFLAEDGKLQVDESVIHYENTLEFKEAEREFLLDSVEGDKSASKSIMESFRKQLRIVLDNTEAHVVTSEQSYNFGI